MLEPKKREYLTAKKILDAYNAGRRDFSGIVCNNDSFGNFDLHGIILDGANLDFCSFHGANLSGADFSGASLEWTSFVRADLRHARFENSRIVWSKFNEAQFEKTNMCGADLGWCLFFNTNLYGGADLTGAITDTLATDPSQITEEGMKKLAEHLGRMRGNIDPELMTRLNLSAVAAEEAASKAKKTEDARDVYEKDSAAYGTNKSRSGSYTNDKGQDNYLGAGKKKKKDIYES